MQEIVLRNKLNINKVFPLVTGGWIANVTDYEGKMKIGNPIIFVPGADPYVLETSGMICEYNGLSLWHHDSIKFIPLGNDGKLSNENGLCGKPHPDYFILKVNRETSDEKMIVVLAVTGLYNGGIVIVHSPTLRSYALKINCMETCFSCDGNNIIAFDKNKVTIIDNPLL